MARYIQATAPTPLTDSARLPAISTKAGAMKWRPIAYKDLLKSLGHTDGIAECLEVARREFAQAASATPNPALYLKQRAAAHSIVAQEYDAASIPVRASALFIVGAYQHLEGYLYAMADEYREFSAKTLRSRATGEAALDWVLDIIPGGLALNRRRIWAERYAALEYYRQVRNAFSHPRKSRGAAIAAYTTAHAYAGIYQSNYGLNAPNLPGALSLDDFLLFARLIKYLALDISRICAPTMSELVDHAKRQAGNGTKQLHSLPRDAGERERRIKKFYSTTFGCRLDPADMIAISAALA